MNVPNDAFPDRGYGVSSNVWQLLLQLQSHLHASWFLEPCAAAKHGRRATKEVIYALT
jgi:hypothetical protein